MSDAPVGLSAGGLSLWVAVTEAHDLDVTQCVQLEEACRAKDRLDEFDSIIHGKGVLQLMQFRVLGRGHDDDGGDQHLTVDVKFDNVIATANATANLMKQLLAALRLPDVKSGARPQYRGARGAQQPSVPGGKLTPLERARARAAG